jgi:Spy/CpxP family protein refolding chaperone
LGAAGAGQRVKGATANIAPASPWPIYNGFDHQPTENELRALHEQDVTPAQAAEIDKLYDQLMSADKKILGSHPKLPWPRISSSIADQLNGVVRANRRDF